MQDCQPFETHVGAESVRNNGAGRRSAGTARSGGPARVEGGRSGGGWSLARWSRRMVLMGCGTVSAVCALVVVVQGSVAAGPRGMGGAGVGEAGGMRAMGGVSAMSGVRGEDKSAGTPERGMSGGLSASRSARVPFLPPAMMSAVLEEPRVESASGVPTSADTDRGEPLLASAVLSPAPTTPAERPAGAGTNGPAQRKAEGKADEEADRSAIPAASSVGASVAVASAVVSMSPQWNTELLHEVTDEPVREASGRDGSGRSASARRAKGLVARALSNPSRTETVWMEVTAYCPCEKCCGEDAQGVTASGKPVSYNRGKFVAADTDLLPFGTRLSIPGYNGGQQVEVIDRGGAIRGQRLDVYFPSHAVAKKWGRRWVPVVVYADGE